MYLIFVIESLIVTVNGSQRIGGILMMMQHPHWQTTILSIYDPMVLLQNLSGYVAMFGFHITFNSFIQWPLSSISNPGIWTFFHSWASHWVSALIDPIIIFPFRTVEDKVMTTKLKPAYGPVVYHNIVGNKVIWMINMPTRNLPINYEIRVCNVVPQRSPDDLFTEV